MKSEQPVLGVPLLYAEPRAAGCCWNPFACFRRWRAEPERSRYVPPTPTSTPYETPSTHQMTESSAEALREALQAHVDARLAELEARRPAPDVACTSLGYSAF